MDHFWGVLGPFWPFWPGFAPFAPEGQEPENRQKVPKKFKKNKKTKMFMGVLRHIWGTFRGLLATFEVFWTVFGCFGPLLG